MKRSTSENIVAAIFAFVIVGALCAVFYFLPNEGQSDAVHTDPRASVYRVVTEDGVGTAFVVDAHLVVTNRHVVGDDVTVKLEDHNRRYRWGTVVYRDELRDVALVYVPGDAGPAPRLRCESLPDDVPVSTVGFPTNLPWAKYRGFVASTAKRHSEIGNYTLLDMSVDPGQSGSPLYDEGGAVAGIILATNTAPVETMAGYGGTPGKTGMAIPGDAFCDALERGGVNARHR